VTFSVKDVAEHFAVGEHSVLGWIKNGELRAVNVGRTPGAKKPRWRVTSEQLAAFEMVRSNAPPPAKPTRRKRQDTSVIEFY